MAEGGGDACGTAARDSVDGGYARGRSVPPAALAAEVQWRLHSPLAAGLAVMRISMVEGAEREGGWNEQDKGGRRPSTAACQGYLMAQRAFFPVGSAKWCRFVLGKDCATGATYPKMWPDGKDIWRLGGGSWPRRVLEWPRVEGWRCYRSKGWMTAPTVVDVRTGCPCTSDRCASSGLAGCDGHCPRSHRPSTPSAESEVVRQLVTTLMPPQAVSGTLEGQLCGGDAGMRWRDYAAGRRWPHVAAARLRQRAELSGFRSRL